MSVYVHCSACGGQAMPEEADEWLKLAGAHRCNYRCASCGVAGVLHYDEHEDPTGTGEWLEYWYFVPDGPSARVT